MPPLGSVLVAAFDLAINRYSFTKVHTGRTNVLLRRLPSLLKPHQIPAMHRLMDVTLSLYLWRPKVEKSALSDSSVSSLRTTRACCLRDGQDHDNALRFPRFCVYEMAKSGAGTNSSRDLADVSGSHTCPKSGHDLMTQLSCLETAALVLDDHVLTEFCGGC